MIFLEKYATMKTVEMTKQKRKTKEPYQYEKVSRTSDVIFGGRKGNF